MYVDLPGLMSPSVVTGDKYRPDLQLTTKNSCRYILELTVGYDTNLRNNINHQHEKYNELIREVNNHFTTVKFINLSISPIGVFEKESSTFLKMLRDDCS